VQGALPRPQKRASWWHRLVFEFTRVDSGHQLGYWACSITYKNTEAKQPPAGNDLLCSSDRAPERRSTRTTPKHGNQHQPAPTRTAKQSQLKTTTNPLTPSHTTTALRRASVPLLPLPSARAGRPQSRGAARWCCHPPPSDRCQRLAPCWPPCFGRALVARWWLRGVGLGFEGEADARHKRERRLVPPGALLRSPLV